MQHSQGAAGSCRSPGTQRGGLLSTLHRHAARAVHAALQVEALEAELAAGLAREGAGRKKRRRGGSDDEAGAKVRFYLFVFSFFPVCWVGGARTQKEAAENQRWRRAGSKV